MEKYSAAVYWAMYTLTSVGYGDISATNTTEMQVCTICLLIGSFMWAYIIGSACSILTSISLEKAEHQQTMDHLNNFLKAKNMPLDFRIELRSFFTQRNILQVSAREQQGRTREIQRLFNVSVTRARVPGKASTLRDRSEG